MMTKYNIDKCELSTHGFGGSLVAIKGSVGKVPWAWSEDYSNCWFAHDCQYWCHQEEAKAPWLMGRSHGSMTLGTALSDCDNDNV